MSYAPTPSPNAPDIPGLDLGPRPAAPPPRRHALGWPAGSVRAVLALALVAVLGLYVYKIDPTQEAPGEIKTLYGYLWLMVFLVLASFFTAHGKTIGNPHVHARSPLGLPTGSVRLLLLLGLGLIVFWLYRENRLSFEMPSLPLEMFLVMPGGFLLGYLVSAVVRRLSRGGQEPPWFQDLEAWVAIVAMVLLVVVLVFHLFINPSLVTSSPVNLTYLEGALAAVVSFYFGARA